MVGRACPNYHSDLLSMEQLDLVLGTHALRAPEINVVQFQRDIPGSDYLNAGGTLEPLRAARLFAEGATLVFSQLQPKVPSLAQLCSSLGKAFSSRMQTNVYLTPAGSQGFPPHWDNHDVFVLQISGRKRWTIYESSYELPLRGEQFDPKTEKAGPVSQEFTLEAGDTAYVPRGLMHAAHSGDVASLHITLGLMAYTWADLLVEGVAAAALADASLRESLPLGFADSEFPAAEKARLVEQKVARLGTHLSAESLFRHLSRQLVVGHRPSCTNLISQVVGLNSLDLGSVMRCRPDVAYEFQDSPEACAMLCNGNRVELPAFVAPALRFALETAPFRIGELPDCVDDAGKLNLVRRLVKEGLLECVSE